MQLPGNWQGSWSSQAVHIRHGREEPQLVFPDMLESAQHPLNYQFPKQFYGKWSLCNTASARHCLRRGHSSTMMKLRTSLSVTQHYSSCLCKSILLSYWHGLLFSKCISRIAVAIGCLVKAAETSAVIYVSISFSDVAMEERERQKKKTWGETENRSCVEQRLTEAGVQRSYLPDQSASSIKKRKRKKSRLQFGFCASLPRHGR